MNAHINHDLALALVAATRELGYELKRDSAHHRDHGLVPVLDTALGTADLLANWSIEAARNNAWTQAQALVALSRFPVVRERYLLALARNVAFASRMLLVKTG